MKRVFIIAKETQKQLIERLTEEVETLTSKLQVYKTLVDDREKEILELITVKDDIFEDSYDYAQMKKRFCFLELKNKGLENAIAHEKRVREFVDENKVHNERGAGRKSKFSELEKGSIRMYRIQGQTIKYIAEMFDCSVVLVHKLRSEKYY